MNQTRPFTTTLLAVSSQSRSRSKETSLEDVIGQNENKFRCIGKLFRDLFEKLVFGMFDRVVVKFEVPVECGVPVEEAAANRLKSEVEAAGDDIGTAAMDRVESKL